MSHYEHIIRTFPLLTLRPSFLDRYKLTYIDAGSMAEAFTAALLMRDEERRNKVSRILTRRAERIQRMTSLAENQKRLDDVVEFIRSQEPIINQVEWSSIFSMNTMSDHRGSARLASGNAEHNSTL